MQSMVRRWSKVHFSSNLKVDQTSCDASQVDQSSFRTYYWIIVFYSVKFTGSKLVPWVVGWNHVLNRVSNSKVAHFDSRSSTCFENSFLSKPSQEPVLLICSKFWTIKYGPIWSTQNVFIVCFQTSSKINVFIFTTLWRLIPGG